MRHLIAQRIKHFLFGFLRRHAGNTLKPATDLSLSGIEIALTTLYLTLHRGNLMLSSVKRSCATIKGLLTLVKAILRGANFAHTLLVFLFNFLLEAERLILRLDNGLSSHRLRLLLRVFNNRGSFFGSPLSGSVYKVTRDDEAKGDADNGTDKQPNNFGHTSLLHQVD